MVPGMTASVPPTVGSRMREAREARGLSRCAVAAQMGRTEERFALYEDGVLVPASPVLARIARLLDVPFESLVDDSVRAVDQQIAAALGGGPIVPEYRRGALITLLSTPMTR